MELIKSNSEKFHQELDYEKVKAAFDAQREELQGEIITSPHDIYSVETLRDRNNLRSSPGVPTDVFVFAKGEAPHPAMTKIGGLPYWPADTTWPIGFNNRPLTFLAQINFKDSEDIVGKLPGDILLFFVEHEQFYAGGDQKSIYFEWVNMGDTALITKDQVPKPSWIFVICYGVIHRTQDYQDIWNSEYYLADTIQGTKIGGLPCYIQEEIETKGRFLFQLASVQAAARVQFPWANVEKPAGLEFNGSGIYADENQLVMADMASIYVFIGDRDELLWELQGY